MNMRRWTCCLLVAAALVMATAAGAQDVPRPQTPSLAALRAVIRPESYVQANGPAATVAVKTVREHVPEGLVGLLYADEPKMMRLVNAAELAEIHLSADEAYAAGLRNLQAALEPTDKVVHPLLPRAIGLVQGSPYAASRLLLHDDWARSSARFGGHLLVAAPTVDTLLYADGSNSGALEALSALARERFVGAPRPLSANVYEWRPDGWAVMAR